MYVDNYNIKDLFIPKNTLRGYLNFRVIIKDEFNHFFYFIKI